MDWIGWTGVGVAVLFGVVACVQGCAAGRRAKSADEKAERLETQFTALGIDVEAISGAAVRTRQLAEDANEIARGALVGVQESHDVDWDAKWQGDSYVLTNLGRDGALQVRGFVQIDKAKHEVAVERVAGGEFFGLDFRELVQEHRARQKQYRPISEVARAYKDKTDLPLVKIHLVWKTQGGVAKTYSPTPFRHDLDA